MKRPDWAQGPQPFAQLLRVAEHEAGLGMILTHAANYGPTPPYIHAADNDGPRVTVNPRNRRRHPDAAWLAEPVPDPRRFKPHVQIQLLPVLFLA